MTIEKTIQDRIWIEDNKVRKIENGDKHTYTFQEFLNKNPETEEEIDIISTIRSTTINDTSKDDVIWSTNEKRNLKANHPKGVKDIGFVSDKTVREHTEFESFTEMKEKCDNIGFSNTGEIIGIEEVEFKERQISNRIPLLSTILILVCVLLFISISFVNIVLTLVITSVSCILYVLLYFTLSTNTYFNDCYHTIPVEMLETPNVIYKNKSYDSFDVVKDDYVVDSDDTVFSIGEEDTSIKSEGNYKIEGKSVYINRPVEDNRVILKEYNVGGKTILADSDSTLPADILEGEGTEENPYKICNGDELRCIKDNNCYEIQDDVAGKISPIDTFEGTIDGDGHEVTIKSARGFIKNNRGTIKNIGFEINYSGRRKIGGVADTNNGIIENVYVKGSIEASDKSGSITTQNNGNISKCISDAEIINREFINNGEINGFYIKGNDFLDSKYVNSNYKIMSKDAMTGLHVSKRMDELDFETTWMEKEKSIPELR